MTLSEKDHLLAVRNQHERRAELVRKQREAEELDFKRRCERLDAQLSRLQEQIKVLDEIRSESYAATPTPNDASQRILGAKPEVEYTPACPSPSQAVARYERETGKLEYSAADIKNYFANGGYNPRRSFYLNLREYLDRQVKNRLMMKSGGGKYKRR